MNEKLFQRVDLNVAQKNFTSFRSDVRKRIHDVCELVRRYVMGLEVASIDTPALGIPSVSEFVDSDFSSLTYRIIADTSKTRYGFRSTLHRSHCGGRFRHSWYRYRMWIGLLRRAASGGVPDVTHEGQDNTRDIGA